MTPFSGDEEPLPPPGSGAPPATVAPGADQYGEPVPGTPGTPEPQEPARHPRRPRRRKRHWLIELAVILVVALAVAVLLRTFVVQTFFIPSGSMEPTLQVGDRIAVSKISYDFQSIHVGDIIVFRRPPAENCGGTPVNDLVKRVIGLPGDTLSLANGQVYVDGRLLAEPWLPAGVKTEPGPNPVPYSLQHPYTVPPGEYYLMGDNRPFSCDSRYWGPIPRSLVVGKVVARVWPLSRLAWF